MAEERFQTLKTVASLIAGAGWLIIVFAVFGIAFAAEELRGAEAIEKLIAFGIPLLLAVFGLVLVANGQLLKCIRAIEHNTRARGEEEAE